MFSSLSTRSHQACTPLALCRTRKKCTSCLSAHGTLFPTAYSAVKNVRHYRDVQWGRNVPGLALLLQWISATSSSPAQDQDACVNSTQKWLSDFLSEGTFSSDSACLKQPQRVCVLLWFCILLSHSSQWADVRRLFTFWSIAVSRQGRKCCMTPDNCPNTSKYQILLSPNLLANLEVIPDLLYWIFIFLLYDETQLCQQHQQRKKFVTSLHQWWRLGNPGLNSQLRQPFPA